VASGERAGSADPLSDDLAWLPVVAERYVRVTGDQAVLDVEVPFLSLRPLRPDELELYELPSISPDVDALRALPAGAPQGLHHRRARAAADREPATGTTG
jgi:cellobiose phosphorylase